MRRLQRLAFRVAVVSALLGLATASGCVPGAGLPRGALAILHPLMLVAGAAAGWAAAQRMKEIDRERWQIVEDGEITKGEREYAHREAEARRRRAGASFLGAPMLLGYCLSSQVEGAEESLLAQLLAVSALLGGIVGMALGRGGRGAAPR